MTQEPPFQLDLFIDSPLNRQLSLVRRALLDGDLGRAQRWLDTAVALAASTDPLLPQWSRLLDQLQGFVPPLADPPAAVQRLVELTTLAEELLGPQSGAALRWPRSNLATALQLLPFGGQPGEHHAAPLWLELGAPEQALASIEQDWLWRECPQRLAWHARANEILHRHDPALLDWTLLALNFPDGAEKPLADSLLLGAAWQEYADLDPMVDTCWFPLWCVLALKLAWPAPPLKLREPASQRAWDALVQGVATAPAQRQEVAFRSWLRGVAPGLQQALLGRAKAR